MLTSFFLNPIWTVSTSSIEHLDGVHHNFTRTEDKTESDSGSAVMKTHICDV